jgi:Ala-tRNA(Pro) deacylase
MIADSLVDRETPVTETPAQSPTKPPDRGPMPDPQDFSRSPERAVFDRLDSLGVAHATRVHEPTRTVADSRLIRTDTPGAHTKNLFMKDKRGELVLVSAWADSDLPLNQLRRALGVQRLSFTDADLLWRMLGVTPGSVSAFALLHDAGGRVRFVLDQALLQWEVLNFHPLRNDMTTSISQADFLRFVDSTGRKAQPVDFGQLKPASGTSPDG